MKKVVFSFLALALLVGIASAQARLEFDASSHEFGDVKEADGPVEHTFQFVNAGDKPIKINSVKASCGCTTPGWTREVIMPGDSGFVTAKYNPRNRPGKFNKSLKLKTNDTAQDKVLYISGYVEPQPKSPEEAYPLVMAGFRFKNRYLNLGQVTTEQPITKTVEVYSPYDSAVSMDLSSWQVPDHITIEVSEEVIAPQSKFYIRVIYDAKKKADYGYVNDLISIDESNGLSVLATIEEYFPEMSAEELDKAPSLSLDSRAHDFGTVKKGEVVTLEIKVQNSGQQKLMIRKIKSNCGCLTYSPIKDVIKKGKSEVLKVTLDTSDLLGNQYKTISIFANDPVSPTTIFTIKGKVTK